MIYNYNLLWKKLIDLNMNKKSLAEQAQISNATLARMKNNKPVSLDVLARICAVLNCKIDDIITIADQ
ncbi:MAG: helix-turn-helix domain-containing protein [Dorea sp.]